MGFLFSLSAWALGPHEEVKDVQILKALPGNVILVNRGLEDGITKNDHVIFALPNEEFVSRGICLKSTIEKSYWRLYRIPYAEKISMDNTYSIVSIDDREIPNPIAQIRFKEFDFPEPKKEEAPTPNPFEIKPDLPERLTERDLIKPARTRTERSFLEKAVDQKRLAQELKNYKVSVYASPFTRQSINDGESYRYGFRGANAGSRYSLLTQFEQQQTKLQDPFTKETVSTRSTFGQAQFVVKRLTPSISSLSLVNYNSYRFGRLATPESHWQVGVIGYTWHIFETKNWEYFDLSYIPLYDNRSTEVITETGKETTVNQEGLRHGIRLAIRNKLTETVAIENLLWVRPFQDLGTWKLQGDDLNLVNDFRLIFNITHNLFFDYNLVYQKDKLWKTLSGLPESNTINSINFRYDFSI